MDFLKLFSSQNNLFISDNLYIFVFNIKVTKVFDFTTVRDINDGHKWGKSLLLVINGKDLSQVFAFVFVIHP